MSAAMFPRLSAVFALLWLAAPVLRAQDVPAVATELADDLKTVETLKGNEDKKGKTRLRPVLGIRFGAFRATGGEILSVDPGSPAAGEGLQVIQLVVAAFLQRQRGRCR